MKRDKHTKIFGTLSSVGSERLPYKQEVTGSNPVASTDFTQASRGGERSHTSLGNPIPVAGSSRPLRADEHSNVCGRWDEPHGKSADLIGMLSPLGWEGVALGARRNSSSCDIDPTSTCP